MAERNKDWFPESPESGYSRPVTVEQAEQIKRRIKRLKRGKQILESAEQSPSAKQFGEIHYFWCVKGQSNFLHSVPVWSSGKPEQFRYHVDLSGSYAESLIKSGILAQENTQEVISIQSVDKNDGK